MTGWRESTDWHHLGAVVARLKRDVEAAYHACNEDRAAAAHDDLVSAEWRLRRAMARRGQNG